MERTDRYLNEFAGTVIQHLQLDGDNRFSARIFIWAFTQEHETEYTDMLDEAREGNHRHGIFHKLHMHIGNWLEQNAARLGIDKAAGQREASISPLGNSSSTQIWIRRN